MKVKLNTNLVPLFGGTYESYWDITECDDNGNELYVDYDLEELLKGIARTYQSYADYIRQELDIGFIKSIKFTGDVWSPREYNFNTDELDFIVDINKTALKRELNWLGHYDKFNAWLGLRFTSYDGFFSYTPNNYKDLCDAITSGKDGYEQSIGALITYLATDKNGNDILKDIEDYIQEKWSCNGYAGTNYTTREEE